MKILVTGATGYLGSDLVKNLKGDIRILTRRDLRKLRYNKGQLVKSVHSKSSYRLPFKAEPLLRNGKLPIIEVVKGDITDIEAVKKAVKGIDLIYHNAALVEHFAPYKQLYKVNVVGTKNIIEAAIKEGVERIIYTSTVAVTDKFKDDYCKSKAVAEELVKKYWGRIEIPVIRPAPIYDTKRLEVLRKYKIPMIKLDMVLHLAYKQGVINALVNAGKRGRSRVYIAADERSVTLSELYETVCKARGYRPFYLPKKIVNIGYGFAWLIESVSDAVGKPYPIYKVMKTMLQGTREYDISLAIKELGYKPANTLEMFRKILSRK